MNTNDSGFGRGFSYKVDATIPYTEQFRNGSISASEYLNEFEMIINTSFSKFIIGVILSSLPDIFAKKSAVPSKNSSEQ